MKATTGDWAVVGGRMRQARRALNLNQAKFHDKYVGSERVGLRTYQRAESGANEAGMMLIESFVKAGINANWLLTGEGSMLLKDLGVEAPPGRPVLAYSRHLGTSLQAGEVGYDPQLLAEVVAALEAALAAKGAALPPDKKGEVITLLYEEALLGDGDKQSRSDRVLRLVKLVS